MYRLLSRLNEMAAGGGPAASGSGDDSPDAVAAVLRALNGDRRDETFPISESGADRPSGYLLFRIGRTAENDLSFPDDPTMSRRHAAVYRVNGKWYCRDLDSVNGTLVGGKILRGQALPAPPGTELRVGRQRLSLEYGQQPGAVTSPPSGKPATTTTPSAPSIRREPVVAPAEPWRWVPPGETVTVRDWTIPGGMLYIGRTLKSLQGYSTEPALINPSLKIAARDEMVRREAARLHQEYGYYSYYNLTYADLSPAARRLYLDWLAGGRQGADLPEPLLIVFFYGLERRLLEHDGEAASPDERAALRAEIERLAALFPGYFRFGRYATALLGHLDARRMIEDESARPDADALINLPRTAHEMPLSLEVALARMARDRTPLPADYGLAWVLHDPDANGPRRMAAQRCPDELRRLWMLRYPMEYPRGMRVSERKTPLNLAYRPASPTLYSWVSLAAPGGLHAPGVAPLKHLRTLFDACCDALDPYSRFIGKRPELRGSPLAVALLPPELRDDHEATRTLAERLQAYLPDPHAVATLDSRTLLAELTGVTSWAEPLGRAESVQAVTLLESQNIALEPDPRRGGPALAPDDGPVAITQLSSSDDTGELAAERDKQFRPLLHLLAVVVTGASGAEVNKDLAPALADAFADAVGGGNAARHAAALTYLLAAPGRVRPAARLPIAATLGPAQRERLGALLADAATEAARLAAGVNRPALAPSPALVRRLASAYRALGLDEARLFDRLHHHTTATAASSVLRSASQTNDDLASLQPAVPAAGYAVPPASADAPLFRKQERHDASDPVRLDAEAVRRKVAETEHVSRLLYTIFDEEDNHPTPLPSPAIETAPDAADGPLNTAHATLLTELMEQDEWTADDFAARARAHDLLPGAALEAINEAAWEVADEPALEGTDPVLVNREAALLVLGGG
jgi:hypothetical protein